MAETLRNQWVTESPAGPEPMLEEAAPAVDTPLWNVIPPRGLDSLSAAISERRAAAAAPGDREASPFIIASRAPEVPPKPKTDWKSRLKSGLSKALPSAVYAMQANVGRPVAGQQWRQGLLRGLAGIGAGMAAESAQEQAAARAKEAREQSLADSLMLLREREKMRAEAGSPEAAAERARAIAEATLPSKKELLRVSNELRDSFDISKNKRAEGMTEKQLADVNNQAIDKVNNYFKANWILNPTEEQSLTMFIKFKEQLLSGYKIPQKPAERIPELPE